MLYTLTKIDLATGNRVIVYEHATANVMTDYWEAHTDSKHKTEISLFAEKPKWCDNCGHPRTSHSRNGCEERGCICTKKYMDF